jgi:hypothetical protein
MGRFVQRFFGVRVLALLGTGCYQVMLYLMARALSSKAKGSFLILATRNRQLPLALLLNFWCA